MTDKLFEQFQRQQTIAPKHDVHDLSDNTTLIQGDQQNTRTEGGDYAERGIDKRTQINVLVTPEFAKEALAPLFHDMPMLLNQSQQSTPRSLYISRLRELFVAASGIDWPERKLWQAFDALVQRRPPNPPLKNSNLFEWMINHLLSLPVNEFDSVIVFMNLLNFKGAVPADFQATFNQWLGEVPPISIPPSIMERLNTLEDHWTYLFIMIERTMHQEGRYTVKAFLWPSPHPIWEGYKDYTCDELSGVFQEIYELLEARDEDLTQLRIEFFLPFTLLMESVHSWTFDDYDEEKRPIFKRHPVVIRSFERFSKQKLKMAKDAQRRRWWHLPDVSCEDWQPRQKAEDHPQAPIFHSVVSSDFEQRLDPLSNDYTFCCFMETCAPAAELVYDHAVLRKMIAAGFPIMVWLSNPVARTTSAYSIIDELLSPSLLKELPQRVYKLRNDQNLSMQQILPENEQFSHSLILLYDDPDHVPTKYDPRCESPSTR